MSLDLPTMRKKKRGCNFTHSEREALLDIVKKYMDILENKSCDAENIKNKREAWQKVAVEYNTVARSGLRTWVQLRHAYENFKQKTKKTIETNKKMRYLPDMGTDGKHQYLPKLLPKLKRAEDRLPNEEIHDVKEEDFEAVYFSENELEAEENANMLDIQSLLTPEIVTDVTENSNLEQVKEMSMKEQYFLTKLENAKLEQKYFIQRERRERLEIHLLKLKIKRLTAHKKMKKGKSTI